MIFQDRESAGYVLAFDLIQFKNEDVIVLAISRGGVPIGVEVAQTLRSPLDILLVQKIGLPFRSDLAAGAICEDQEPVWNEIIVANAGLELDDFYNAVKFSEKLIRHDTDTFRSGKKLSALTKKTIILVDDGIATGASMLAAIKYLKQHRVEKIIVAAPVASNSAIRRLQEKVTQVIVLQKVEELGSVREWYENYLELSSDKIKLLLQKGQTKNDLEESAP